VERCRATWLGVELCLRRAESWETGIGGLPVVGGRRVTRPKIEGYSVSMLQAYDGPWENPGGVHA
jgi:hypothetical protein